MNLNTIRVLWRQPDLMSLWGIPYAMRPGQSPRDLWEGRQISDVLALAAGHYGQMISFPGPHEGWIWLGQPGWWGNLSSETQAAITAFLEPLRKADLVPTGPGEWQDVTVELHALRPGPEDCTCSSCERRRDLRAFARAMEDADDSEV